MRDKVFLDTNVFIYSIDSSSGMRRKRDVARSLVTENIRQETGVISIQVLQEFYQVATKKIQTPISTKDALEFLHYIAVLETVHPDFNMIVSAIRLQQKHQLSFWDSLIIQDAINAGCTQLLTEDLQDGLQIEDLFVHNPFPPSFHTTVG